ncbi:Predicted arabinose efflux permease, MFS family [Massilia sp. PDC64]|nr:Predicted arabinose efflux permease, MFS family [Massilia sp. PDC64]
MASDTVYGMRLDPISPADGFAVLRNRNVSFYLVARFLGTIAVQMMSVAVGWQIYALTHSLFDLGLIGLAQFAPFLVLILWAGHVADSHDRRVIVMLCMAVQLLCNLGLMALTWSDTGAVWPVFAVLVLYGSARAFMMPAQQAVLRNLVPDQVFARAVALNSSTMTVARILGPVLGGLLYGFGANVVYLLSSVMLAVSVLLMAGTCSAGRASVKGPMSWHTLLEGLHFVRSRPVVLGAISLDLFAVLFGGATALLPAYAHDVLHAGPSSLGLLRTAPGAGAALGSIALAIWPVQRRVGAWMFGGVAVFGLATIVMGLTASFMVALAALFLLGLGDSVSVYIRHLLVQYETPDAIRGRVSAVNAVFIGASNELGEFESGLTASWLGLVRAIVIGGVATLCVTAAWIRLFPVLSRMDRFPHHASEADHVTSIDKP